MIGLWLGAAAPVPPQGLEGPTLWRTFYKVARSKQGITASLSLMHLHTDIAELTTGSKASPTDSTNLWVTMQHKSGTAPIWRDKATCHRSDLRLRIESAMLFC